MEELGSRLRDGAKLSRALPASYVVQVLDKRRVCRIHDEIIRMWGVLLLLMGAMLIYWMVSDVRELVR